MANREGPPCFSVLLEGWQLPRTGGVQPLLLQPLLLLMLGAHLPLSELAHELVLAVDWLCSSEHVESWHRGLGRGGAS
jgi:hypothetical protein